MSKKRRTLKKRKGARHAAATAPLVLASKSSSEQTYDRLVRVLSVIAVTLVLTVAIALHVVLPTLDRTAEDSVTVKHFLYLYAAASGSYLLISARAKHHWSHRRFDASVRLVRMDVVIAAAMLGATVALTLSYTAAFQTVAEFVVEHWPQIRAIGSEIVAKVIDWTVGGIVFEIIRRICNRVVRNAISRN